MFQRSNWLVFVFFFFRFLRTCSREVRHVVCAANLLFPSKNYFLSFVHGIKTFT